MINRSTFIIIALVFLLMATKESFATQEVLDFSSGIYSSQWSGYINQYDEDGFTVRTSEVWHEFHETWGTYGPTLAWYEHVIEIIVESNVGKFDLNSMTYPHRNWAGLIFRDPNGSVITTSYDTENSVIYFNELDSRNLNYFTISTQLDFDVLSEVDNINVTLVPEPIRIAGVNPLYYSSLQAAYDDAGNGDIIQCREVELSKNLYIDENKSITIEGGYDNAYTNIIGTTFLNGFIVLTDGVAVIEYFSLH